MSPFELAETQQEPSCGHFFAERNLKHIVRIVQDLLLKNLSNKKLISGGLLALERLAAAYPVTRYERGWSVDSVTTSNANTTLNLSRFVISLLTSSTSPFPLDLSGHQRLANHELCSLANSVSSRRALSLIGDLVSGMACVAIRHSTLAEDPDADWGALSRDSRNLAMLLDSLTAHVLRLLSIVVGVVEDLPMTNVQNQSSNTSSAMKPVMQSLSSASLSPIRKRASTSRTPSFLGSIDSNAKDGPPPLSDLNITSKKRHGSGGQIASQFDAIYFKLYEVLKATYSNYKVRRLFSSHVSNLSHPGHYRITN